MATTPERPASLTGWDQDHPEQASEPSGAKKEGDGDLVEPSVSNVEWRGWEIADAEERVEEDEFEKRVGERVKQVESWIEEGVPKDAVDVMDDAINRMAGLEVEKKASGLTDEEIWSQHDAGAAATESQIAEKLPPELQDKMAEIGESLRGGSSPKEIIIGAESKEDQQALVALELLGEHMRDEIVHRQEQHKKGDGELSATEKSIAILGDEVERRALAAQVLSMDEEQMKQFVTNEPETARELKDAFIENRDERHSADSVRDYFGQAVRTLDQYDRSIDGAADTITADTGTLGEAPETSTEVVISGETAEGDGSSSQVIEAGGTGLRESDLEPQPSSQSAHPDLETVVADTGTIGDAPGQESQTLGGVEYAQDDGSSTEVVESASMRVTEEELRAAEEAAQSAEWENVVADTAVVTEQEEFTSSTQPLEGPGVVVFDTDSVDFEGVGTYAEESKKLSEKDRLDEEFNEATVEVPADVEDFSPEKEREAVVEKDKKKEKYRIRIQGSEGTDVEKVARASSDQELLDGLAELKERNAKKGYLMKFELLGEDGYDEDRLDRIKEGFEVISVEYTDAEEARARERQQREQQREQQRLENQQRREAVQRQRQAALTERRRVRQEASVEAARLAATPDDTKSVLRLGARDLQERQRVLSDRLARRRGARGHEQAAAGMLHTMKRVEGALAPESYTQMMNAIQAHRMIDSKRGARKQRYLQNLYADLEHAGSQEGNWLERNVSTPFERQGARWEIASGINKLRLRKGTREVIAAREDAIASMRAAAQDERLHEGMRVLIDQMADELEVVNCRDTEYAYRRRWDQWLRGKEKDVNFPKPAREAAPSAATSVEAGNAVPENAAGAVASSDEGSESSASPDVAEVPVTEHGSVKRHFQVRAVDSQGVTRRERAEGPSKSAVKAYYKRTHPDWTNLKIRRKKERLGDGGGRSEAAGGTTAQAA